MKPVISVTYIGAPIRKGPANLATATIKLGFAEWSVEVRDLRVLESKQGGAWVAQPTYSLSDGKNGWKYFSSVTLDADLQKLVSEAVLAAYAAYVKKNGAFTNVHGVTVDASDIGF